MDRKSRNSSYYDVNKDKKSLNPFSSDVRIDKKSWNLSSCDVCKDKKSCIPSNGWQSKRSILQRNRYMLEHQLGTDVNFIVSNSESGQKAVKIAAHKYVLISGSEVFLCMFEGEMKEQGDVTVTDIEPQAFKEMLKFLYYENADLTEDLVIQIMYASKKYMIHGLTAKCTDFLQKTLTINNVTIILQDSLFFDLELLKNTCINIIRNNARVVLYSPSFRQISHSTLLLILKDDCLRINEVEVFRACLDWAETRIIGQPCDGKTHSEMLRKQLGNAIFHIRFPQMSISEFADVAVPSGILTKEEENLCLRYLTQREKPKHIPFPIYPRHWANVNIPGRYDWYNMK